MAKRTVGVVRGDLTDAQVAQLAHAGLTGGRPSDLLLANLEHPDHGRGIHIVARIELELGCGSNGVTSECPDLLVTRETGRR